MDPRPDTQFLSRRTEEAMLQEGWVDGGRTLDVACGAGWLAAKVRGRGGEGWGIDASQEMLGLAPFLFPRDQAVLVRGIAEVLPFRDGSFDRVICQGSLDHFVDPNAFMREAARVLRPDGRLAIALANYESLSCRLGRLRQRWERDVLHQPQPAHRFYWQPPPDHYHKGELPFVRRLGGRWLQLERCYGVSLLWLLKDWDKWLEQMPRFLADPLLGALDRTAYWTPALADVIVSVWRPRNQQGP